MKSKTLPLNVTRAASVRREIKVSQTFTLDSLLGESLLPSLCFRGFRILVEGMCHLASAKNKLRRQHKSQSSKSESNAFSNIIFLDILNIICSWLITAWMKDPPADLVLSRVGSLSLWTSPSPPWMSPARSWRIGEGHLQRERKRRKMDCKFFLSTEWTLYSTRKKASIDLPQMYSN